MEKLDQSKEHQIGDLIKHLLKKHSLSMRKLSSLCGMDTATISRIVNGKQQPKLIHLKQFSEHLDISLDKLIEASGYDIVDEKKERDMGILNSLDEIGKILGNSKLFDPQITTALIEQELVKYEQYAQTEEGHRMICHEFTAKVNQVNGVGPFIEHLKEMHMRYCDENTPSNYRTLLGSALLYFILSADIIPDYIFPVGYLDDAIAVYLVLDRLNQKGYTA
ncbi:helix-turn-helix domain-containing protein [Cohnella abietis]|uniref:Transcriptional regulator n=1 Tax=Cohnella abietis TaxID=2507935 RepID=A0A3T1D946_9BACL|nr:helix-turn-helix domain-containing protein [Cohnella abietis]BBI34610.1 transcriptional regulator [Cohnella abietis]